MSSLMARGFADEQYSAELEGLFHKTELESKQLLKSIENEREQIAAIKKQLEFRPKQIKIVEAETRRCEEEVKQLHRQWTHSNVMIETLKKQGARLDEEIETLQNKREGLVKTTAERAIEYNEKLENYKAVWKSYEQKYESSPKAQEFKKLQKEVDELEVKKSELVQKRESLERRLSQLTTSNNGICKAQKPRWTDWFVQLATIKLETMKLENESAEVQQAKLNALEENNFLKQKLASLTAKQLATLETREVAYEATQEQYEDQADDEPTGNEAITAPEDDTSLVNPTQTQQLPGLEHSSSESSQQMPQFTFSEANNDGSDVEATAFITTGGNEPMFSQTGFTFSGFGEDVNISQQGASTGLQFTTESNPNTAFGHFSFTSPGVGGNSGHGATGMSCFGSPASVTSGGQENFFSLFSGSQTPKNDTTKSVFDF